MAFELPPLTYAFDALEPHIDATTMEIHHDRHHKAYVDNANAALADTPWATSSVEEVVTSLDEMPDDIRMAVRNNAGGHYNHSLFWEIMAPGGPAAPSGALEAAIVSAFGSVEDMTAAVNGAGVKRFGSGWSWLVVSGGTLEVMSTPNQDTPLAQGMTPILGVDVWEHAYYLTYQNKRPAYLAAWWNVVNWDVVAAKFEAA
ncbi:MAG: superoxide dismutase [Thermoleophilia bacterium]|nr:superoxide dismutase [Thermoleophilia bacterium]